MRIKFTFDSTELKINLRAAPFSGRSPVLHYIRKGSIYKGLIPGLEINNEKKN
ncbi:MAG: hypothetical protein KAT17_04890 [Candidatus Aminicenantes bacterium]|nr:hypothetical protein [Candidatus Aminicenantes bacterium]